jgi:hypothetical protein
MSNKTGAAAIGIAAERDPKPLRDRPPARHRLLHDAEHRNSDFVGEIPVQKVDVPVTRGQAHVGRQHQLNSCELHQSFFGVHR